MTRSKGSLLESGLFGKKSTNPLWTVDSSLLDSLKDIVVQRRDDRKLVALSTARVYAEC